MRLGNCGRNLTMMLPDESEPAWTADFQEGLIVGFLIIGVLAIATGVATLLSPAPIELGEMGQRVAASEVDEMGSNSVIPR